MNKMRIFMLLSSLLPINGCATITKGTGDVLQVNVTNCSQPMQCSATNKKGSWDFTVPGPVKFKKSDDDLHITCEDGEHKISIRATPTRGGMGWGNIVFGGLLGAGIDSSTDAHWDMVDGISIARRTCYGKSID